MLKLQQTKFRGTVTYFSDVIMAVTTMFTTLFLLFISALTVFIINTHVNVDVFGDASYDTSQSGAALSAILDSQAEGYHVKDLLAYSVWQGSETFEIAGGKIDLKKTFSSLAAAFGISEYSATLKVSGREILLSKAGVKPEKKLKCFEHLIYADGRTGKLEFCSSRIGD